MIFDFSDPNLYVNWVEEYTKALYDPNIRYIFLKGSAGAGKSVVVSQLTVQEVLEGAEYAWIRKIRATIKNSCYQTLYNQAKDWELFDALDFQKSLNIQSLRNDGKTLFLGLDDPEKVKSLAGLDRIVIEEATDLNFEDYLQLNIRLRGRKNQKLIALFNPVSDQHWLKKEIRDNPKWDWSKTVWIEKTVLDNKFADEIYINSLKNLEFTNPEMYKVYFLNQWGSLRQGQIYKDYSVSDQSIKEPQVGGLDFGYNDPCVLTYLKEVDVMGQNKKTLQIEEMIYKTGLDLPGLIQEFENVGVPKNLKIIADSSRPEMIEGLRKAGYNVVGCTKYAGSVYEGVVRMQKYHLELINATNGVKEVQNYFWKEKQGQVLDQPQDGFDHFLDGARYGSEHFTRPNFIDIKSIKAKLTEKQTKGI